MATTISITCSQGVRRSAAILVSSVGLTFRRSRASRPAYALAWAKGHSSALGLAAILGIGFALRIWGIGFGLPYAYHWDEKSYSGAALNLGAGTAGAQMNPTGFGTILFLEYALYFVVGRLAGTFSSMADFGRAYRLDPSAFLLMARLTSALLATCTAAVVYELGRRLAGQAAALCAALLAAVAFLYVRESHYGVPDASAAFFVSLGVLALVLMVETRKPAMGYAAAAVAGFAVVLKWSTWPVLFPLVLAFYLDRRAARHGTAAGAHPARAWLLLLALAGGLLGGGFQLLLRPGFYINSALQEFRAGQGGGFWEWQVDTLPGWLFYIKTLIYGLGPVYLILALLGLLLRLARVVLTRDPSSALFLAFPLLYFGLMGSTRHYFARYAVLLLPFLAVFAGDAIVTGVRWTTGRGLRQARIGIAALLILAAAQPVALSIRSDQLLTRADTRTLAKGWIEANITEGSHVALDLPVFGPSLSTPDKPAALAARTYMVTVMYGEGLSGHPVRWYRDNGFDYLVTSSFASDLALISRDQDERRRKFYAGLDNELDLVAEFRPYAANVSAPFVFDEVYGPFVSLWQRERPGPVLKVYRVSE